jgi:hypothetical protein
MRSDLELTKYALRLWSIEGVPKEVNRANARKWLQSVKNLGPRWLYAEDFTQRARQYVAKQQRSPL